MTNLRMRVPVPFPANVAGDGGITVYKLNGEWIIAPDFGALAALASVSDPAVTSVWIYNATTGVYNQITLSLLLQSVAQTGSGYAVALMVDTSSTADGDPGAGKLRFDNATQNAAATFFVDLLDSVGANISTVLDQLDDSTSVVKGQWSLVKIGDPSKRFMGTLTAVTTATGYRKLSIAVTYSTSASPFSNGDAVLFSFVRAGDSSGGNVSGPGTVTAGQIAAFADATGMLLQAYTAAQTLAYLGIGANPGGPAYNDVALQRDSAWAHIARARSHFYSAQ